MMRVAMDPLLDMLSRYRWTTAWVLAWGIVAVVLELLT